MTTKRSTADEACEIERILNMDAEEILVEARREGLEPEAIAARGREILAAAERHIASRCRFVCPHGDQCTRDDECPLCHAQRVLGDDFPREIEKERR